jgi:DNA-binding NarL/FixJ family response regulator/chemotaxis signal transduction protein
MRVLLADENPEFLKAAERILSLAPHLKVVGGASSGEEAVDQTKALDPELVLMNWSLPGMNGLEATRRIKAQPNPPKVIIFSLQDYPEYRLAAKEAGAEGFIPQSDFGQKIPSLIDFLIAQEDLQKPISTGRPGRENPQTPFNRPAEESSEPPRKETGPSFFETSKSASGSPDRSPADQQMPELLETLREGLTAMETHYRYLQRWLEGGKDCAPRPRDGVQKVRKFSEPFGEDATYYLLFEVRNEWYALPADQVVSVEQPASLIRLPRDFQPLVGLTDFNRRRVPVIDLRLWEKLDQAPPGEAGRLILVETKGVAAGLLVDAVRDLITCTASDGYPLPIDSAVSRKPFRDRLIQVKGRFLYVWDVDQLLAGLK